MGNAFYDGRGVPAEIRKQDLEKLALCTWAFVRSMKRHLSPEDEDEDAFRVELLRKLPKPQALAIINATHRPNRALQDLSLAIENLPMHFMRKNEIQQAVTIFEDNLGSSERLLTSPVPLFYSRHTARFLSVWLLLLPLGLYDTFGDSWNHIGLIPATAILSVFLFGIEELATQLEEPFTILPMQAFCDKIYNWCTEIASWTAGDNGMEVKQPLPQHTVQQSSPVKEMARETTEDNPVETLTNSETDPSEVNGYGVLGNLAGVLQTETMLSRSIAVQNEESSREVVSLHQNDAEHLRSEMEGSEVPNAFEPQACFEEEDNALPNTQSDGETQDGDIFTTYVHEHEAAKSLSPKSECPSIGETSPNAASPTLDKDVNEFQYFSDSDNVMEGPELGSMDPNFNTASVEENPSFENPTIVRDRFYVASKLHEQIPSTTFDSERPRAPNTDDSIHHTSSTQGFELDVDEGVVSPTEEGIVAGFDNELTPANPLPDVYLVDDVDEQVAGASSGNIEVSAEDDEYPNGKSLASATSEDVDPPSLDNDNVELVTSERKFDSVSKFEEPEADIDLERIAPELSREAVEYNRLSESIVDAKAFDLREELVSAEGFDKNSAPGSVTLTENSQAYGEVQLESQPPETPPSSLAEKANPVAAISTSTNSAPEKNLNLQDESVSGLSNEIHASTEEEPLQFRNDLTENDAIDDPSHPNQANGTPTDLLNAGKPSPALKTNTHTDSLGNVRPDMPDTESSSSSEMSGSDDGVISFDRESEASRTPSDSWLSRHKETFQAIYGYKEEFSEPDATDSGRSDEGKELAYSFASDGQITLPVDNVAYESALFREKQPSLSSNVQSAMWDVQEISEPESSREEHVEDQVDYAQSAPESVPAHQFTARPPPSSENLVQLLFN